MAIVLVRFDGGNVPVVTGAIPPDADTPISNPTQTGFTTNQAIIVEEDEYCFGLDTSIPLHAAVADGAGGGWRAGRDHLPEKMMKASAGLLAALTLLSGCGVKPTDYPLAAGQANQAQAPLDVDPDHPFVVMTFSGGGSRAAALAAAVVKRLNDLHYTAGGESRALSADIAVVSSVSGGSVYAADLGLNGPAHACELHAADPGLRRHRLAHAPLPESVHLAVAAIRKRDPYRCAAGDDRGPAADQGDDGGAQSARQAADAAQCHRHGRRPGVHLRSGRRWTMSAWTTTGCPSVSASPPRRPFQSPSRPCLLHNDSVSAAEVPGTTESQSALPRHVAERPAAPTRTWSLPHGAISPVAAQRGRGRAGLRRQGSALSDARSICVLSMAAWRTTRALPRCAARCWRTGAPADIGRLTAQGKLRHLVVIAVNARSDPQSDLDNVHAVHHAF